MHILHRKRRRGMHHALWGFALGVLVGAILSNHGDTLVGYFLQPRKAAVVRTSFVTYMPGREDASSSDKLPEFGGAVYPVSRVPNWGAMRTPAEWNRTYEEMRDEDFVPVPSYELALSDVRVRSLLTRTPQQQKILTAKLFYSTRFMGKYDLDAGEFSGTHNGVDLKLPEGMPVGCIGGGRVAAVREDTILGKHVLVEHEHPTEGRIVSIYGHLDTVVVRKSQDLAPGDIIGTVGMTGNTSAPHLHLAIDRTTDAVHHAAFQPERAPSRKVWGTHALNPIRFIQANRDAEKYASGIRAAL